jgi:AAA+ ATPase superfamily predicted ATPase
MFVGRTEELGVLEDIWSGRSPKTCAVYGRRRVGKTTLVDRFCSDKKHIRFSFIRSTEEKNAAVMDSALARYKGTGPLGLVSFQQALDVLSDVIAEDDIVVFMDELAYLIEQAPHVSSELQHFIDRRLNGSGSMLIICSSAVSKIKAEIESEDRPLYGRFINRIHVRQLQYWQCERMHPEMGREDALRTYMTIGGYPAYHEAIQDGSFRDMVVKRFLGPNAPLAEEAVSMLSSELSPVPVIEAILLDISQGCTDAKRIAEREGISKALCGRYLRAMEELEIVGHVNPMANSDRRTKIYRIKDPLIGFWHMVLYRNLDISSSPNREAAFDAMGEDISTYLGFRFEDVCEEYMRRRFLCKGLGKWWGWTDGEVSDIDIVAEVVDGKERYAVLAECKFRSRRAGASVLEDLEFRSRFVKGYNNVRLMIFSGSGFTDELLEIAESRDDLELVSLDGLFPGWDRRKWTSSSGAG